MKYIFAPLLHVFIQQATHDNAPSLLIAHLLLKLSSYGSPAGDSYGSPTGGVISATPNPAINPRLPSGGSTIYSASGDASRASAFQANPNPFTTQDDSFTAPEPPLVQPGYG